METYTVVFIDYAGNPHCNAPELKLLVFKGSREDLRDKLEEDGIIDCVMKIFKGELETI